MHLSQALKQFWRSTPHSNLGIIQNSVCFVQQQDVSEHSFGFCNPVSLSLDSTTSVMVVQRKGLVLKVK